MRFFLPKLVHYRISAQIVLFVVLTVTAVCALNWQNLGASPSVSYAHFRHPQLGYAVDFPRGWSVTRKDLDGYETTRFIEPLVASSVEPLQTAITIQVVPAQGISSAREWVKHRELLQFTQTDLAHMTVESRRIGRKQVQFLVDEPSAYGLVRAFVKVGQSIVVFSLTPWGMPAFGIARDSANMRTMEHMIGTFRM